MTRASKRLARKLLPLSVVIGLILQGAPTAVAAFIEQSCGSTVVTEPTTTGVAGQFFSTSIVVTMANADTLAVDTDDVAGLAGSGLSVTPMGSNELEISGIPVAGTFPTKFKATGANCISRLYPGVMPFYYAFTFSGGGGGQGTPVAPPLNVGDPRFEGSLKLGDTVICTPSTFSLTPTSVKVNITKDGTALTGANVTNYDGASATGSASVLLTSELLGATIGCSISAVSGSSSGNSSANFGVVYRASEFSFIIEFPDDELRTGTTSALERADHANATKDGFIGGAFVLVGKDIDFLTYTIRPATNGTPPATPGADEVAVTKTVTSPERIGIQTPELPAGEYEIVARGTTTRPGTYVLDVTIEKPIVSIAKAKSDPSIVAPVAGRYLPEVVANAVNNLNSGLPVDTPRGELAREIAAVNNGAPVLQTWTATTSVVTPAAAVAAMPVASDVAIQTKPLMELFKRTFPTGVKIQYQAYSAKLTAASVQQLRKLATLPITAISVTGYVQLSRNKSNDYSLSLARAKAVASILTKAKMKKAIITVRAGGVGGKTVANRSAILNIK